MMEIKSKKFGVLSDGREVLLFILDNGHMKMSVTNYGACITSILLPSNTDNCTYDDVVLGYSTLEGYIANEPHFGSLIGRVAGRISNAEVAIDKKTYPLLANDGKNCLHSGYPAYDKQLWNANCNSTVDNATVFFERRSHSGEQGFPGSVQLLISYTLTADNEIILRYYGKTDAPTFINLTNHTYFNLNPSGMQSDGNYISVLNHELLISATKYLETDKDLLPTGNILPVAGTDYDFTKPKLIKNIAKTGGLDTCYLLKKEVNNYKVLSCVLNEPTTNRMLRVYSTQPALNVYTGNFLNGQIGKNGNRYSKFSGICLESQNCPDSPTHKNFPSALLLPEQIYRQETVWYFTF